MSYRAKQYSVLLAFGAGIYGLYKLLRNWRNTESPDDIEQKKHLDEALNQALKDTFPGSDPVAIVQPPHSRDDKNAT